MGSIIKMAYRNIGRNRRRTMLTGATVMVVVIVLIFLICYGAGMLDHMFNTTARLTTGHVKIYPQGYADKETLMPIDLSIMDSEKVSSAIGGVDKVVSHSRRIKFFTMIQHEDRDEFPVIMGIEPEAEKDILMLDQNMARGNYLGQGRREAIIGTGLARKLGIVENITDDYKPGSAKVQILAPRGIPMTFTIVGLFRFGFSMMDDNMMFVRFEDAQYAADMDLDDMTTEIIVMLEDKNMSLATIPAIEKAVGKSADLAELEILPWQAQGFLYEMMQNAFGIMVVGLFLLFFIAGSTIINTMLMAVMERTREIGMLMSLGMKGKEIVVLILAESISIGITGGIIGTLIGAGVALVFSYTGIPIGGMEDMPIPIGDRLHVAFIWWAPLAAFIYGLIISIIASLWPAAKAARLSPTEALRTI